MNEPAPPRPEPGLHVARTAQTVLMRAVGLADMYLAPVLKQFVQCQLDAGRRRFALDLSLCTGLDSTFMGTLASLARSLPEQGGRLFVLNVSADNRRLLSMLGVYPLLSIRNDIAIENVDTIRLAPTDDAGLRLRQIHDAHRQLVDVDARNRERFGRFLDAIEKELPAASAGCAAFSFRTDAEFPEFDGLDDDLMPLDDLALPLDDDNDTPPAGTPAPY